MVTTTLPRRESICDGQCVTMQSVAAFGDLGFLDWMLLWTSDANLVPSTQKKNGVGITSTRVIEDQFVTQFCRMVRDNEYKECGFRLTDEPWAHIHPMSIQGERILCIALLHCT